MGDQQQGVEGWRVTAALGGHDGFAVQAGGLGYIIDHEAARLPGAGDVPAELLAARQYPVGCRGVDRHVLTLVPG